WRYIITLKSKSYAEAISIIPILSIGSIFLGIYYNQSVWYKLSDRNKFGAYITLGGAIITITMNLLLIPIFKYNGAAWATLSSYLFMMITSYILGQKYYPVHYDVKRIGFYIFSVISLFAIHQLIGFFLPSIWIHLLTAVLLLGSFFVLVLKIDRNEFLSLPILGKYLQKNK
ncbi:MAG: hypothetical protein RIQ62_411, partial [Bacteroidota bacterium]